MIVIQRRFHESWSKAGVTKIHAVQSRWIASIHGDLPRCRLRAASESGAGCNKLLNKLDMGQWIGCRLASSNTTAARVKAKRQ